MSRRIDQLLRDNREWAAEFEKSHPGEFIKQAQQQTPDYLWIGCSDSRVPANTIIGLEPGELFVHRNVANMVNHSDLNVLSVLEYAVNFLKVKDIILCGHYGCGGVISALEHREHGIVDNWLRPIKDIYFNNRENLKNISDEEKKIDQLCELNVIEQVHKICYTSIVQNAWLRNQKLSVHGVIYNVKNGLLKDLKVTASSMKDVDEIYKMDEK